jgi:hypothetical protein
LAQACRAGQVHPLTVSLSVPSMCPQCSISSLSTIGSSLPRWRGAPSDCIPRCALNVPSMCPLTVSLNVPSMCPQCSISSLSTIGSSLPAGEVRPL